MKPNLEYVISATGMMQVNSNFLYENHRDLLHHSCKELMDCLYSSIKSKTKYTTPTIATLFNAYTESNYGERLVSLDKIGSSSVYADSGGLQIVTAGKTVNDAIKDKIYATQTVADYAMCFDVIPLESLSITRTRNERSNTGNKIFNNAQHKESGRLTGINIKNQVAAFRKHNAKTKVIVIIQGNNANDMMDYYQQIAAQLSEEDYENISGMAIADTCIGNGVLESIEMLKGAKAISKICHDNIKKHLHILGVGSISRMRPILYLIKSGYLNTFEKVSYDSSSHTSTFDYGLLKVNGTCRALGSTRTPRAEAHFKNVYQLFNGFLAPKIEESEFLNIILGDGVRDWKFSTIRAIAHTLEKDKLIVAYLAKMMHTYYQIDNFVTCLDKVFDEKSCKIPEIDSLRQVKSDHDMDMWFQHVSRHVSSKRIKRKENHGTLEGLFE